MLLHPLGGGKGKARAQVEEADIEGKVIRLCRSIADDQGAGTAIRGRIGYDLAGCLAFDDRLALVHLVGNGLSCTLEFPRDARAATSSCFAGSSLIAFAAAETLRLPSSTVSTSDAVTFSCAAFAERTDRSETLSIVAALDWVGKFSDPRVGWLSPTLKRAIFAATVAHWLSSTCRRRRFREITNAIGSASGAMSENWTHTGSTPAATHAR
jgi:hypothetical protein